MALFNDKEKDLKVTAEETKNDLTTHFNEIIDSAERLLKETAHTADDKTKELRESLTHQIKSVRDSMGEHAKPICKKGKEVIHATDDYVKAHPWASVGIAAATAFAVTLLMRRK